MDFKIIENFTDSEFGKKEKAAKTARVHELAARGFEDEKIIIDIIKNEKPIPKKLPAELYDMVNYMCRRKMDRIARFEIEYDFIPDIRILKTVLLCLIEAAPVFHSQFIDNHIKPYWRVSDYRIDDIFSVQKTDNLQQSADEFLLNDIPVKSNVQIKIRLLICGGKSRLCFIFNHMCMDGGGVKSFLNDLFRGYDSYLKNGTVNVFYSDKSRAYERVYDDMSEEDKRAAKKLFAGNTVKDRHSLPFTPADKADKKIFVRKKIGADVFEPARLKAKQYGATANDLICAAYIRAFYDVSGCEETEKIGISCAVDLRRYMKRPENIGYTNHTAFMPCTVDSMGETMADTLKAVVKSTVEAKSDKFVGLHGQPLLNLGFSTMVYAQAEMITGLFYNVANLSVSNVGAITAEAFAMGNHSPTGVWVGGAAKDKPCAALNVLSYAGDLMLTTCIKGNESDRKILSLFFDRIEENLRLL